MQSFFLFFNGIFSKNLLFQIIFLQKKKKDHQTGLYVKDMRAAISSLPHYPILLSRNFFEYI